MTNILAVKGYNAGLRFVLKDITTIGRADDNSIVIPENPVSRYHAEIIRQNLNFIIKDKDSTNGIFVNGRKVSESVLLRNDEIRIGSSVFIYDSDLDFQNAIYNNKSLIISKGEDETIRLQSPDESFEVPETECHSLFLLTELAEIFSEDFDILSSDSFNNICTHIRNIFRADSIILMIFDEVSRALKPLVIMSESENFGVSSRILRESFYDRKPILFSGTKTEDIILNETPEGNGDIPRFSLKKNTREVSLMSAPLIHNEKCRGIVLIENNKLDYYSLKDLSVFKTVATFVTIALAQSEEIEKLKFDRKQSISPVVLLGENNAIKDKIQMAEKASEYNTTVLLTGETGTGKDVFARKIHSESRRKDYPFIAINCSAIPHELFESEFFGHEKGSFTGALKMQKGKVELAHGGTLFLDEIGDMPLAIQPKLLRFLEDRSFYRVGGSKPIKVDTRIITATNKNLEDEVNKGTFRRDLLFRLSVFQINLPPLRERKSDIKILADYFLRKFSTEIKKDILGFSDEAIILLQKMPWYGNIRELANCIERAVIMTNERIISPEHLRTSETLAYENTTVKNPWTGSVSIKEIIENSNIPASEITLKNMEKNLIEFALKKCGNNQAQAAKMLDIHRNTMSNKIKEYNIII